MPVISGSILCNPLLPLMCPCLVLPALCSLCLSFFSVSASPLLHLLYSRFGPRHFSHPSLFSVSHRCSISPTSTTNLPPFKLALDLTHLLLSRPNLVASSVPYSSSLFGPYAYGVS